MADEFDLEAINNELLTMQTFAERFARNVAVLRKKLQPVSTGRSKKNAATEDQIADVLLKRKKRIIKKHCKALQ